MNRTPASESKQVQNRTKKEKKPGRKPAGSDRRRPASNMKSDQAPGQRSVKKTRPQQKNASGSYLLIVDGSSLLATSYYSSLPKVVRKEKDEDRKQELCEKILSRDSHGRYTNALELFFHTLFTIMTFQHPSHLVICWDVTRHTFRKDLWQSYKSNRSETPIPLREQFESAYDICEKLGIAQYRDSHFEADDFAGTLCTVMEEYMDVRILTRDKDYFQLISDKTRIWYGMSDLDKVREWRKKHQMAPCLPSRVVEVDRSVLKAEFGYLPESVPMIKALAGDTSDNIPGVSGIGEIRSMMLAEHYFSPEELYRDIEKANTAQKKKRLNRMWQQWGINKSPYTCLTKKSTPKRRSAREMADLCFILGRIRTDIDLDEYSGCGFIPDLLRFTVTRRRLSQVLSEYEIELEIGRKKKPAFIQKTQKSGLNQSRQNSARPESADRKKNSGSRNSKRMKKLTQPDSAQKSQKAKSAVKNSADPKKEMNRKTAQPSQKQSSSVKKRRRPPRKNVRSSSNSEIRIQIPAQNRNSASAFSAN